MPRLPKLEMNTPYASTADCCREMHCSEAQWAGLAAVVVHLCPLLDPLRTAPVCPAPLP